VPNGDTTAAGSSGDGASENQDDDDESWISSRTSGANDPSSRVHASDAFYI